MPNNLKRFQQTGRTHFVTFSCRGRRPLLTTDARDAFLQSLERMRRLYRFHVYAYVVMPEHVHILLSEPKVKTLAAALQAVKQSVARRFAPGGRFWEARYFDHNVRGWEGFKEKVDYIHFNPVKRGLSLSEAGWPWSSFEHYATGCEGAVEIESEWTARRREKLAAASPHPSQHRA